MEVKGKHGPLSVELGDVVGFKSDVEQYGKVVRIDRRPHGLVLLTIENKHSFQGEYLRGQTSTVESAADCWKD